MKIKTERKRRQLKKRAGLIAVLLLVCLLFSACGTGPIEPEEDGKLKITVTVFPVYDWVRNIVGTDNEDVQLTLLLQNGTDMHSFQPTVQDLLRISDSDLFIYIGGFSDAWVSDALKEVRNERQQALDLMALLGDAVREEEFPEGMQEEHAHEEGDAHGHEEEDVHEADEHIWLSLRNAALLTGKISQTLQTLDPAHAAVYQKNTEAYLEKLASLDKAYEDVVRAGKHDTLLFGDRFPFRYLTEDYGLNYYAAFAGCSAETEASFETVRFLAEKADELQLHTILTIEKSDGRIAETIAANTKTKDLEILTLDSLQGVTGQDVAAGTTYLSVMEKNLEVLKTALE